MPVAGPDSEKKKRVTAPKKPTTAPNELAATAVKKTINPLKKKKAEVTRANALLKNQKDAALAKKKKDAALAKKKKETALLVKKKKVTTPAKNKKPSTAKKGGVGPDINTLRKHAKLLGIKLPLSTTTTKTKHSLQKLLEYM